MSCRQPSRVGFQRVLLAPLLALVLGRAVPSLGADAEDLRRAAEAEQARRARIGSPAPVYRGLEMGPLYSALTAYLSMATSIALEGMPPRPAIATRDTLSRAEPAATPRPGATPGAGEPERDEAWWRERLDAAAKRIRDLESDLDWTRQRLFIVQTGLVYANDAMREFNRKVEHDSLLAERSRLEAELGEARKEPARIREEARRDGVLPGWLR